MMNRKLVAALVAFGLALPAATRAQDAPVEEQIVKQMNKVFGVHAESTSDSVLIIDRDWRVSYLNGPAWAQVAEGRDSGSRSIDPAYRRLP
ncbi:hypothetical protein MA20_47240 [Bradyrhizobium japonicum]|uniref:Uncharacterized protein n=1 Tax=Bradyrhizobium japonicum TaxID=375 RepID=A0A0A3XIJ6_BRAJP|nr:hypothetical protein [Bradyrhizobium japonicum]KGT72971.1 hypothetical protein MA20_47240 [Bradyrhizobium japonicum]MCW2220759.1 hypothetical protein [Bradyrhizobium japonicum]MCW2345373.1 hypothetical protein [Bradyrhizobium japonicum]